MISSIRILTEWPAAVPALKGRTFEYAPGLNVLFGRNGCGKTTLLRTTAAYVGCKPHGGWSTWVTPLEGNRVKPKGTGVFGGPPVPYPAVFAAHAPGNADADVEWDGAPAFFHLAEESDVKLWSFEQDHDLLGTGVGLMHDQRIAASSGQKRKRRIEQLRAALEAPPCLTKVAQTGVNDIWIGAEQRFVDHVKRLRGGRRKFVTTVLLDEPDRSLDLPTQAVFWRKAIPSLVKDGFQVIVATHSVFALFMESGCPGVVVHDLEGGYAARCREDVVEFVTGEST